MYKISIIVATFNAEKYLQICLDNINIQKCENVELIIIDGGSIDNTNEIIKSNQKYIDYWISERDNGVYDAWNKGVSVAKGDWIMFLGADDILLPKALDSYIQFINENEERFDIISSKLDFVNVNGLHLRFVGESWNWNKFKMSRMSFAHPGLLHNANLFKSNGLFDTSFKICSDSEFFLRTQGRIKAGFIDIVTVKMQTGGISHSFKAIVETYQIRKKNKTLSTTKNSFRFLRFLVIFYLSRIKHSL